MDSYIRSSGIVSFILSPQVQIGVLVFVLSKAVLEYLRRNVKRPPGPWGLPVIGHLHLLGNAPNVSFVNLRAAYGDVFRIRLGSWPTVVINGKDAIQDALHSYKDAFSARPPFFGFSLGDGPGFTFGEFDDIAILHRKMAAKVLSSFSSPKNSQVEELVQREVETLLACFASNKGRSFNPHNEIFLAVASIIYQICYGRLENIRENRDFVQQVFRSERFNEFAVAGSIVNIFPWLRFITPWKVAPLKDLIKKATELRTRKIEEHEKNFDPNYLRDITDGLIGVSKSGSKSAQQLGKGRIFNCLDDIIGAGFGTLGSTLEWMILLMAAHPEIQTRVQQEIDDIVGPSRVPSLEDRDNMVYTDATMHEMMRFMSLVPLSLPHCATADTEFRGYFISKGTVVFINLYSMSHDPAVWGDPELFRPDRFINASGRIRTELLDHFLPFSIGRRRCFGEALARVELFLFYTGIMQKCCFVKPPEVEIYDLEANVALSRTPKPYMVQVVTRV